jgi:hypothetical protein
MLGVRRKKGIEGFEMKVLCSLSTVIRIALWVAGIAISLGVAIGYQVGSAPHQAPSDFRAISADHGRRCVDDADARDRQPGADGARRLPGLS